MTSPRPLTSPCKGEVGREAAGRGSKFARTKAMTKRARRLRTELPDAEAILWRAVRRDQLEGLSFRRQHPIGPYVLDFYCPEIRLGIEIDGGQHSLPKEVAKDSVRTEWLASKKIRMLRFWNNDALENIHGVLSEIARVANDRPSDLTPSPTLPLSGGGRSKRSRL